MKKAPSPTTVKELPNEVNYIPPPSKLINLFGRLKLSIGRLVDANKCLGLAAIYLFVVLACVCRLVGVLN